MDNHPAPFTLAGRVVILLAIVIAVGGTIRNFWSWHDSGEEVRHSVATLAFVPCLVAAAFTIISYWVLRFFGIPFGKDRR